MNTELYQELIIDHGTNPRNFKVLPEPSYQAEGYNPLCGDQITLYLLIDNAKIIQANFQGHGCAICIASASIMTELLINQTIEQALNLFDKFTNLIIAKDPESNANTVIIKSLPTKLLALIGVKNYPSRVKCATLAWHALNSALTTKDTQD